MFIYFACKILVVGTLVPNGSKILCGIYKELTYIVCVAKVGSCTFVDLDSVEVVAGVGPGI
jgi:hypothetical protein